MSDSDETILLLNKANTGDQSAIGELLIKHRARLLRVVNFRMDRRLKTRIDAHDVIQEACLDATQRFSKYLEERTMPFFVWLRFLTLQKLMELHRHHFGVQARDAGREVSINRAPAAQPTSAILAAQLLGKRTSPSQAAMRVELQAEVEQAINDMDHIDREVLALRHFEQLTNLEVADVLEITESAASNRYIRAARRLRKAMTANDPEESFG